MNQNINEMLEKLNVDCSNDKGLYKQSQCHCNSKMLYAEDYSNPNGKFVVDGKEYFTRRKVLMKINSNGQKNINNQQNIVNKYKSAQQLLQNPLYKSLIQTSQLWLPSSSLNASINSNQSPCQLAQITWDQIQFNPVWFYKNYICANKPCVINDVMQGDDIYQRWADPKYLQEVLQNYGNISMSLTPDGFADSIKGQFFIQPEEIKTSMKRFINHQQEFPNAIPYIQHQNSSLTEEMWILNAEVDQDPVQFLSKHFFNGVQPDAQNFWMGYNQSVSALHKDPYENFYTTITGEKHFTLLPPIDVLFLQQQTFRKAKWTYHQQTHQFTCHQKLNEPVTNWISCNPDLQQDIQNQSSFPLLSKLHKFHVTLTKGQMLYLPSLWYHQVSQDSKKDAYTLAINYWFDMQFNQNYSLYQMCRKLKGL